jgi:glycerate kinase
MRVVVAPDKFKGSLTAAQVAARVAAGLVRAAPGAEVGAALAGWADAVRRATGRDEAATTGAGAAGGVGFAALAVLGATPRPGIDLVLDLVGFQSLLPGPSWSRRASWPPTPSPTSSPTRSAAWPRPAPCWSGWPSGSRRTGCATIAR